MTSLHPGGKCEPCESHEHKDCVGWKPPGFCGCADGLCALRLITGVMWDVNDSPNGHDDD